MSAETKALVASWARSFMAAALGVVFADLSTGASVDPKQVLVAGAIAVLPVILRWLNPNDLAFGKK